MNHQKKKPSKTKKDISEPKNFMHIEHLGLEDVQQNENYAERDVSETSTAYGNKFSETCQKLSMSGSFEAVLRNLIREETKIICQKAQEETIKLLEAKSEKTIKILEAKTEQIVGEIGRLFNGKQAGSSTDSVDHGHFKTTTECHKPSLTNKASAMANSSKVFKSMPDLSSSDEHGQGRPSSLPRYKKTVDGVCRVTSIDRQTSIKKKIAVQKSYSKPCLAIRRECMSQALQANIVPIVEGLEFTRSELPEQLIGAGHMTEEECDSIRTYKNRKDQIRFVVSRTKSRSLQDMEFFLGLITHQIPHVVNQIMEQFESNLKRNDTTTKCELCLCFENIDVKEVVDRLYSIGAISDSFYRNTINCSKPRGCQEYLWQKLIDICNNKQTAEKQKVFHILFKYIQKVGERGTFDFIATGLKNMFYVERKLSCHCQYPFNFKTQLSERDSNDSSRLSSSYYSPRSSASDERKSRLSDERQVSSCYSPRSSVSDERRSRLSDDLYKETDIDADSQRTYWKTVRQPSSNEDMTDETLPKQKIYQTKSLDMLDTISEDTGMAFKKDAHIVHQTLEFHHPVRVQVDFEGTPRNRNTSGACSANHEKRTRRYGSVIKMDDINLTNLPHNSCV